MTLKHVHIGEVGISPPPTRPPSPTHSTVHSPPNPPTLAPSLLLPPPPTRGLQIGSEVSNSVSEVPRKPVSTVWTPELMESPTAPGAISSLRMIAAAGGLALPVAPQALLYC